MRSGSRELSYTSRLDISEAVKNANKLKDSFRQMREEASKTIKIGAASGLDTKPITANQQAHLALRKTLIDSQVETQRLRTEGVSLANSYKQGQITAQGFRNDIERLKVSEQDLKNQYQQGKLTLQQYTQQIEQNKIAQQGLNAALTQASIDNKRASTAIKEHNLQQKQLLEAARQARQNFRAASGSYDEAAAKLKTLGASIRAAENGFKSTSPAIRNQIAEYNKLNQSLKDFDAKMGNHQRNVGNYKGAVNSLIGDLKSLALGYLSLQGAIAAATATFNTALTQDATRTSLEFTLKSTDLSNAKMKELAETANRLGVEYNALTKTYASFAGAAVAANFPLNQTNKIFNSVTGAAARFHLTADQLSGSLLAIQQMISKGTVQAEEMRGQLGERLPGAFSIAARAMGVTEQELGKMLKNGEVLASDLLPKLATELDKTFSLDKNTQIDSLTASWERFKNTFSEAVNDQSNINSFFKSFIDGITEVSGALLKTTNSSSWKEFFLRVSGSFKAGMGDYGGYGMNTVLADRENTKNDPVTAAINDFMGKERKAQIEDIKTLTTIRDRAFELAKSGNKEDIEYLREQQRILVALRQAYHNLYNSKKEVAEAKIVPDEELKSITEIRKRITDLSKMPGSAIDGSAIKIRIDSLKERLKGNKSEEAAAYKSALDFSEKLNKFHADSVKNQMSSDDQELESVRLKYAEMRKEADKFFNDPKNKGQVVRDTTGRPVSKSQVYGQMKADQAADEGIVTYNQNAKKQLAALDIQKQQYINYENFINNYGEIAASERYDRQVVTFKEYLNSLKTEAAKIEVIPEASRTGAQVEYLKELNKRITEEDNNHRDKQVETFERLLSANQTYLQARKQLQEKYNKESAELRAAGYNEEADQLAINFEKSINELDQSQVETLNAYKELFNGIDDLTDKQAKKNIKTVRAYIDKSFDPSSETYRKVKKQLDDLEKSLAENVPKGLKEVANAFGFVASEVSGINEGLATALKTLGKMVNNVANVKQGMLDFQKASATGSVFGQITSSLGILGSAIGIVSGIYNLFFDNSKEQKEFEDAFKYRQEARLKSTLAINKALARQLELVKDIYGPERLVAYTKQINDLNTAISNSRGDLTGKYTLTNDLKSNEIITQFNNLPKEQKSTRATAGLLEALNQRGTKAQALPVASQSIEDLKKLLDSGRLDETTAGYVQNVIDLNDQLSDTKKILNEEITGINFDTLISNIRSVFESGKTDAKSFADAMEGSIKGAFAKAFQRNEIEKQMEGFYKMLGEAGADGTFTKDEVQALRDERDNVSKLLAERAKVYQDILGPDNGDTTALQKGIKGITADQANALEGIMRGQYDQQKKMVFRLDEHSGFWRQHLDIAMNGIRQLEAIQINTANTVTRLDAAVSELVKGNDELKAINNNTKPVNLRGGGLGI